MPNIKSAIKRVNVIEKKTLRNNMIKSEYKTAVKRFEEALNNNNVEDCPIILSSFLLGWVSNSSIIIFTY